MSERNNELAAKRKELLADFLCVFGHVDVPQLVLIVGDQPAVEVGPSQPEEANLDSILVDDVVVIPLSNVFACADVFDVAHQPWELAGFRQFQCVIRGEIEVMIAVTGDIDIEQS